MIGKLNAKPECLINHREFSFETLEYKLLVSKVHNNVEKYFVYRVVVFVVVFVAGIPCEYNRS